MQGFTRELIAALRVSGGESSAVANDPIYSAMHPKQRAFFSHPAKAKALLGGRQAGKTYGVAMWLLVGWMLHPNQASVYITKTATSAVRRIWPMLLKVAKRFGLRFKANHGDLTITMPNGYTTPRSIIEGDSHGSLPGYWRSRFHRLAHC